MASACVNNIGMSSESFLDCPSYTSYGWLSPRISFSRDFVEKGSKIAGEKASSSVDGLENIPKKPDLEATVKDFGDFEFRLDDPVTMLPADELFYEGKLVPLQLGSVQTSAGSLASVQTRSPDSAKSRRRVEISVSDHYALSPKAPRCSSRWKELLGLKKIHNPKPELQKAVSLPSKSSNAKSLKYFLTRNPRPSTIDSSLSLPLLRDSDSESVSISSRLSLSSSSSSGPDHEDLPRISLDSEKSNPTTHSRNRNPPRVRVSKPKHVSENPRPFTDHPPVRVGRSPMRRVPSDSGTIPARGVSVDSPRMNASGKIVFQSLERSSSSPSSFNGGSRNGRYRAMERSYSANVRVAPVLNVPVCSLRGSSKSGSVFGFGQLFSPQKREVVKCQSRVRNDRIL